MKKKTINSFQEYLELIGELEGLGAEIVLFRGQGSKRPLLPSIARKNSKVDTTKMEEQMLLEFTRRTRLILSTTLSDDWEKLVFAQHFGMATRLLDWTSNPLIGLWFACSEQYNINSDGYLYILRGSEDMLINDDHKNKGPFVTSKTKIFRPELNNERIVSQAGWFTAHKFSQRAKRFVPLDTNPDTKDLITEVKIPKEVKEEILDKLSVFGVNSQSLFPDITGVCQHISWMFQKEIV